jgi:threonine dehydrogenase-like Zn-dependent dehydrogenase
VWSYTLTAPRTFELLDLPAPASADLAQGRVLLRTQVAGICGSDLPAYLGRHSGRPEDVGWAGAELPGFPAHEIVGEVVATASPDLQVGDAVVGWATDSDALSEFVMTEACDLMVYTGLRPEVAIALQPLACVLSAVDRLPAISGRTVAVLGQGPIGILFSYVLKAAGAAHVIGVDPIDRRPIAASFGVDEAVRATSDRWAAAIGRSEPRPSIVIEAVGHQTATVSDALRAVANEGFVFAFGVNDQDFYPISMTALFRKNLTLLSGMTIRRHAALEAAWRFHLSHPGLLERYVTNVLPVSEVEKAFGFAVSPAPDQLKVVLTADSKIQNEVTP